MGVYGNVSVCVLFRITGGGGRERERVNVFLCEYKEALWGGWEGEGGSVGV